jgi:DNA-binding response OmpR family regulator
MSEKKQIIIIEDEIQFAKMVKLRLESEGYNVHIATDAYAGTQEILKKNFDLIILDLMMPAGGGFSILERINKFPGKSIIPVIILTGKNLDNQVREQAEAHHVAAIFHKPYDNQEFVGLIHSLLRT